VTCIDLNRKLHEQPFKPFRISLIDGRSYNVTAPRRVMVGETRAVIVTESATGKRGWETALDWTTVSIEHVVGMPDLRMSKQRRKLK
jgi:hypothetical protein